MALIEAKEGDEGGLSDVSSEVGFEGLSFFANAIAEALRLSMVTDW